MVNFSVIIPLYNKAPHIKRTISSVLEQTYVNFELIVVDDGSTDNSFEIVKKITDNRVRLIQQKNSGVSAARNRGIAEAKYELITFLDADDEWTSNLLETFVWMNEKYPQAGMIGSSYWIVDTDGEKKIPKFYNVPQKDGIIENYFKAAIKKNPTSSSSVMTHKEVFNKLGGFPLNLKRGEDSFMWSKIALHYPVAFIDKPLAINYQNAVNRASGNDNLIDEFPLLEYIEKLNLDLDDKTTYYVKEFINKKYLGRVTQSLRVGDKKKAKELIQKTNKTNEFKKKYLKLKFISYLPSSLLAWIYNFKK